MDRRTENEENALRRNFLIADAVIKGLEENKSYITRIDTRDRRISFSKHANFESLRSIYEVEPFRGEGTMSVVFGRFVVSEEDGTSFLEYIVPEFKGDSVNVEVVMRGVYRIENCLERLKQERLSAVAS